MDENLPVIQTQGNRQADSPTGRPTFSETYCHRFLNICVITETVQELPRALYLCVLLTPSVK